jgi:hypothetical protein
MNTDSVQIHQGDQKDGFNQQIRRPEINKLPFRDVESESDRVADLLDDIWNGRRSPLEILRDANAQLREWGEGLEIGLNEANAHIEQLERGE